LKTEQARKITSKKGKAAMNMKIATQLTLLYRGFQNYFSLYAGLASRVQK
jgi:hypothetical protein